ncbi:MAG: ribonuclease P [Methanospirillum sp.]|nr:ribonuclease P [Methanospirillum sp.]
MRTDVRTLAGGDTSVERMALEAGALGYGAIVSVGGTAGTVGRVRVIPGVTVRAASPNRAMAEIRRAPEGAFVTVRLGDPGFNRAAAGLPGVHALCGVHRCRKNAFDHVAARTAAERGTAVELLLEPLVRERGGRRQVAISRYADVVELHARYGFPLVLGSGASSCLDLRAPRAVRALCQLFGLDAESVERALGAVEGLLAPGGPVREVE